MQMEITPDDKYSLSRVIIMSVQKLHSSLHVIAFTTFCAC